MSAHPSEAVDIAAELVLGAEPSSVFGEREALSGPLSELKIAIFEHP